MAKSANDMSRTTVSMKLQIHRGQIVLSRLLETRKSATNSALLLIVFLLTSCASSPEKETRFYELEGARNFRDFGGYVTYRQ